MKPSSKLMIVLVFGLCCQVQAQNTDQNAIKNSPPTPQVDKLSGGPGGSNSGSPGFQTNYLILGQECGLYLCDDWKEGSIELHDGTLFKDRMFRYNIYNQQMEYAVHGDTAAIGNPEDLEKLVIEDKTFVYREFECNGKVRQGYLQLLVHGKYELLLHRGIRFVYEEDPSDSDNGGPVTRYYQDTRYFLSCEGKIAEPLPDKKNAIISMLEEDEKELKKYVKENKCKLKSEEELTEFFVFVNNN